MTLDDLKDQLREQWTELRGKIEESPAFNTLRERYETLTPSAQLGVKAGAAIFAIMVVVYFPYSYFSSSSDSVALFEEKRSLIRKLLRASRTANDGGSVDNPPASAQLIENVRSQLQGFSLLPEQIGDISSIDNTALGGRYAPKEIEQEGIGVNLKKLNIKQVIEIGHSLQTALGQGVRLVGMDVRAASPDPHYFDVVFKLARFSLPMSPASTPAPGANRRGGRPAPGKGKQVETEEEEE